MTNIKEITPWLLKNPIAPSIAAIRENISLSYDKILQWCMEKIDNENTINIFEGAGGLFVPIEKKKQFSI